MSSYINNQGYSPGGHSSSSTVVRVTSTNLSTGVSGVGTTVLSATALLNNISDHLINAINSNDPKAVIHFARILQQNIAALAAIVVVA